MNKQMNEKKEDKEVKQYFFSFPTDIGVLCLGLNPGSTVPGTEEGLNKY